MLEESMHKITVEGEVWFRHFRNLIQLPLKPDLSEAGNSTFKPAHTNSTDGYSRRFLIACLLIAALGYGSPAIAHDSNCDNSTAGDPIHCEEDATSTDNIAISASSIDIDTTGADAEGVKACLLYTSPSPRDS